MVFRGKPSKGCGECRRKKIRCDQIRPACSQCLKSRDGRLCPGYREELALRFCDESNEVAHKAQVKEVLKLRRRAHGSVNPSDSSEASSGSSSDFDGLCLTSLRNKSSICSFKGSSLPGAPGPSVETQGIQYFLANYVTSDPDLCSGHMQNLLSWKTTQSKTLQVAMEAVGLAALSVRRSNPILMANARRQYALALRMTKSHLQDPAQCKQDRTMTAVGLLGFFEVMTCSSSMSMKAWTNHINGSIALLNLRGVDMLDSEFGSAVFIQARSQILKSCYQREVRVPPIILELGRRLPRTPNSSCSIVNDLADSIYRLCELRASIRDGSLTDPYTNIASLLELDDAVVNWGAERSSQWDYTIVFDSTKPSIIYDDAYAVYHTHWIAGVWNVQRATRIFIQEAILAQIDEMLAQPEPIITTLDPQSQRSRSLAIICETAFDICASVPYLLGHDKRYDEQLSSPAPAVWAYFSLPAIYLAGSTLGVPQSMRLYVLGRLRHIGHSLGIQESLMMAAILQSKIDEGKVEELEGLPRQFREEMGRSVEESYDKVCWDGAWEKSSQNEEQDPECAAGGMYFGGWGQQVVSSG
ncbi:hypothetical protein EPUS_03085 [Endocarpon pusillum Z07020]|uniref:Zn(2)-C6 fungal-type domain-containing protein n=1 Tax=Endocarpon pusillum (strain Z07020 / HMAS-L-300199) TaxID=1263415 RepID=U1GLZ1_ENDPU|nr:uncharacterized protein EPUS_03085 [Endocarpon pusillum Z07020]ERF73253.1 hypothetical protein EPUS_03085 [Endocarpon pusillum Z07020]